MFKHKTATINSIIVAQFFYIIYNTIFLALVATKYQEKHFFKLVITHFGVVKTSSHNIF